MSLGAFGDEGNVCIPCQENGGFCEHHPAICHYCGLPVRLHGKNNNWCSMSEAAHLAMVNLEYQLKLARHANDTLRAENKRLKCHRITDTSPGERDAAPLKPVHWRRWVVLGPEGELRRFCLTEGEACETACGDEDVQEVAIYPVDHDVSVYDASHRGTPLMPATPDTSPANVARVLRDVAHEDGRTLFEIDFYLTLADALDQQAAVPDPKRFAGLVLIGGEALMSFFPRTFSTPEPMGARPVAEMYAATVLAAAFPELAPPND